MSIAQHLLRPHVAAVALTLLFFVAHVDIVDGVACKTPTGVPSLLSACDCTAQAITCNNKGLTAMPANLTNCTQYAARGILSIFFVRIPGSLQVGAFPSLSTISHIGTIFLVCVLYTYMVSHSRPVSRRLRAPCIRRSAALPVPSRRSLSLLESQSNNQIMSIPNTTFHGLTSVTSIQLVSSHDMRAVRVPS